jgi:hypothetical protein
MQGVHDLATISLQSHCSLAQISPRPAISLRSRYDLATISPRRFVTILGTFGRGRQVLFMETLREPRRRANTPFVIKEPKTPYYDAEPPPPPQSPADNRPTSAPVTAPLRAQALPGAPGHEISTRSPHDHHGISKTRTPISWRPAADLQGLSGGERLAFMGSCSGSGSDHPMRIEAVDGFAVMPSEAAGPNPVWRS